MNELLKKYKELLKTTINPDDFTWDDLGFDEPMEGFKDVDDYLENGVNGVFKLTTSQEIDEFIDV